MTREKAIIKMVQGKNIKAPNGEFIYYENGQFFVKYKENHIYTIDALYLQNNPEGYEIYTPPIPDKAPVMCWDDFATCSKTYRFNDAVNNVTFDFEGKRNGTFFENIIQIPEDDIPVWMIEAKKNLEN